MISSNDEVIPCLWPQQTHSALFVPGRRPHLPPLELVDQVHLGGAASRGRQVVGSSGRLRRGRWPGVSLLVNAIGVRAEKIENLFSKVQFFCSRSKKYELSKTLHMWSRAPQAHGQSPIGQDSRQRAGSNNFPEQKFL